jgi:copper chaperone CopZ
MKTIGLVAAVVVLAVAMVAVRSRTAEHRQSRDLAAQAVPDNVKTVTLKVPKMDCAGCEIGVRITASKVDGVKETRTDSDKRTAQVVFDASRTSAQAIASAIKSSTGFDAEIPTTK